MASGGDLTQKCLSSRLGSLQDNELPSNGEEPDDGESNEANGTGPNERRDDGGAVWPSDSAREWVHPSAFRRFANLDAPEGLPPLSLADQTRRSAITVAAMGFLVAGLLLLTVPTPPAPQPTARLGFHPQPSLFVTYASSPRTAVPRGAMVSKVLLQGSLLIPFHHGDIIIGCDHEPIVSASELTDCLSTHRIGEVIQIDYVRNQVEQHADVQLTAGP